MIRQSWRLSRLQWLLVLGAAASFAVAIWDLAEGGFYFRVFGIRVSSWEAYKPIRNGIICGIVALCLRDRVAARTTWAALSARATAVAAAAVILSTILALRYGIYAAGGADAFGYVSQSYLWASGRLLWRDPFVSLAPVLGSAITPLGYTLSHTRAAFVPIYPAGLPLTIAVASRIAGAQAVYLVVPLLGGLTVWLTYVLGSRVVDRATGMVAAVLVAFSPIFVFQTLEPMSDVPVTAWWLAAFVSALSTRKWSALLAGAAVSIAVLTRPNLLPLSLPIACLLAAGDGRVSRLALFAAGAAPGCAILLALNAYWYGSALRSGYGPLDTLYGWGHAVPNLRNYGAWLVELHSPGVVLAIAGPVFKRIAALGAMLAFLAILLLSYLFYLVFDNWTFLRFLLPGLPILFIFAAAALVGVIERLPHAVRGATAVIVLALIPLSFLVTADRRQVFDIGRAERRYLAVGEFIGYRLPANAVVLTMIQSGSVRLYGARPTLRWDVIEPARLEGAIDALKARGYVPYILLEHWEEPRFRERFATATPLGVLDWPPAVRYFGLSDTRIYSPDDRDRHLRGDAILPLVVPFHE